MQKSTFHILFGMIACMWLSILYFFSLVAHLPVFIPAVAWLCSGSFAYYYLTKTAGIHIDTTPVKHRWWQILILTAGIALVTRSTLNQLYIHGSNDAIGMWNYYARFLSNDRWQELFRVTGYYHPNHPLGLSSLIAFGWRLTDSTQALWPIALSFLVVLLLPVLIFIALWEKSIVLAVFTLILFATDLPFHGYSYAQIADLPVALCFLGAFICMQAYQRSGNSAFVFMCAALLGSCLWLKNEGLLLALVFCLFYWKELSRRKALKLVLAGLLPFAVTLLVYKCCYATASDLLRPGTINLTQALTNKQAYGKIFLSLRESLHNNFYVVQAAFLLYLVVQLIRRQWLARSICCLLVCLAGILSVYLITPTDLDWQLGTSLTRVLFELMPSFLFCLGIAFATMRSPGFTGTDHLSDT